MQVVRNDKALPYTRAFMDIFVVELIYLLEGLERTGQTNQNERPETVLPGETQWFDNETAADLGAAD